MSFLTRVADIRGLKKLRAGIRDIRGARVHAFAAGPAEAVGKRGAFLADGAKRALP